MMDIAIAGYQMPVGTNVRKNMDKIVGAIDWAGDHGAEILLTPEGSLSGYTHEFDVQEVIDSLQVVTGHASRRNVGLALGTCFVEEDGICYNQIRFYRPDGEFLGFHSKTLCCGSVDGQNRGELNHYGQSKLRVFNWKDGIRIGGLICNDLWANPGCTPMPDSHLSQQLSTMGADVIFHAVNGGRDGGPMSDLAWQYHESNLRMRAHAGNLWIVTADSSAPQTIPCSAPSGVIDPTGSFVCRTESTGERLFSYTISITGIRP